MMERILILIYRRATSSRCPGGCSLDSPLGRVDLYNLAVPNVEIIHITLGMALQRFKKQFPSL